MTNVSKTAEKTEVRRQLISAAVSVLESQGWQVTRERGDVRGRVRRITKNGRSQLAAIRTSQDHWIAFPRTADDKKWVTLSDVDVVVAAVVDDPTNPRLARVHMFDARDLAKRFDRTYKARQDAGHQIQKGRGLWVPLYQKTGDNPVYFVGGGVGLDSPPVATVPLAGSSRNPPPPPFDLPTVPAGEDDDSAEPLTIAQAKARLARTLGVDPGSIKIIVEG